MQRAVILRSVDMISLSIVVDKQVHVTCHLPALKIASQQVQRVRMGRQTTSTETFLRFFGNRTFMDINTFFGQKPAFGRSADNNLYGPVTFSLTATPLLAPV